MKLCSRFPIISDPRHLCLGHSLLLIGNEGMGKNTGDYTRATIGIHFPIPTYNQEVVVEKGRGASPGRQEAPTHLEACCGC